MFFQSSAKLFLGKFSRLPLHLLIAEALRIVKYHIKPAHVQKTGVRNGFTKQEHIREELPIFAIEKVI